MFMLKLKIIYSIVFSIEIQLQMGNNLSKISHLAFKWYECASLLSISKSISVKFGELNSITALYKTHNKIMWEMKSHSCDKLIYGFIHSFDLRLISFCLMTTQKPLKRTRRNANWNSETMEHNRMEQWNCFLLFIIIIISIIKLINYIVELYQMYWLHWVAWIGKLTNVI